MSGTRRPRTTRGTPYQHRYGPLDERPTGTIALLPEEYEAIRLADREGLSQREAARLMDTSQATLSRLLAKARKKTADALAEGKTLTTARL